MICILYSGICRVTILDSMDNHGLPAALYMQGKVKQNLNGRNKTCLWNQTGVYGSISRDIDTKKNVQYLWTKCLKALPKTMCNYVI